jgi:hypothetical protein
MERMVRWGAWCGLAGGALRVGTAFIPWQAGNAWLELVYAATDLAMLFATIAVGLAASRALGRIGFACWAVAVAGLASIVGPDPVAFGIDFYRLGAGIFVLALGAMAAVLLVRRTLRTASGLWLASALLALASIASPLAFAAAGLILGLGFIAAGWAILRSSELRVRASEK